MIHGCNCTTYCMCKQLLMLVTHVEAESKRYIWRQMLYLEVNIVSGDISAVLEYNMTQEALY